MMAANDDHMTWHDTYPSMNTQSQITLSVVLALGFTMMLGPFAIDTYLPAFPLISESLGVSTHQVSLSISIYFVGFAIGQLSGGALSDRYGRRRVLIAGLCIFSAASFFLSQIDSIELLLLGRFLQAIGGGWTGVSVPALVRDRVDGIQAAKLFSMIGLVSVAAPAVAPAIGSLLLAIGSWELIFISLGIYALCLLPLLAATVFRGPRKTAEKKDSISVLSRYQSVLQVRPAMPYIWWQTASFGGLMMFVTYASFVYQGHYAQTRTQFVVLFACNIIAIFSANLLNRFLLNRFAPRQIMFNATCVQVLAGALLLSTALFNLPVYFFLPSMMLYAGTLGAISPNIQACYLQYFPHAAASAAAVLGAVQFGLGGLLSGASNLLPETLRSVTGSIAICSLASMYCMLWARRREAEDQCSFGNQ